MLDWTSVGIVALYSLIGLIVLLGLSCIVSGFVNALRKDEPINILTSTVPLEMLSEIIRQRFDEDEDADDSLDTIRFNGVKCAENCEDKDA